MLPIQTKPLTSSKQHLIKQSESRKRHEHNTNYDPLGILLTFHINFYGGHVPKHSPTLYVKRRENYMYLQLKPSPKFDIFSVK